MLAVFKTLDDGRWMNLLRIYIVREKLNKSYINSMEFTSPQVLFLPLHDDVLPLFSWIWWIWTVCASSCDNSTAWTSDCTR